MMKRLIALMTAVVLLSAATAAAEDAASDQLDLAEMSLEELMNVEVTSVSKKAEPIFQAPSAVFVISQDDIRRSGATNLPDVLRMAPGVHVGRIDANKWAVGVRGFNGSFANKLLVLIDGRSVYTPLFSGVYWDVQDVVLSDIDRIELIRGPGATLWGANAVNGVINIITKKAQETRDTRANLSFGSKDRGTATFRYGHALNDQASFRVWGKRLNYDNFEDQSGYSTDDHWDLLHGGFRLDAKTSPNSDITIQGDAYTGSTGFTGLFPSLAAPYFDVINQRGNMAGANILGRWTGALWSRTKTTAQVYFDVADRDDGWTDARVTTFDLDLQHNWAPSEQIEFTAGSGARLIQDKIGTTDYVSTTPSSDNYRVFSAFAQSKVDLIKNHLGLTLGSKFEHNSFTGYEYQPSIRASWSPNSRLSLWSAVSRAVRTPSRGERTANLWIGNVPPISAGNPSDLLMTMHIVPSPGFGSEEILAKEIGIRLYPHSKFWVDGALFQNQYKDMILGELGQVQMSLSNPPTLDLPLSTVNGTNLKTRGAELAVDWRPSGSVRAQATYTYIERYDASQVETIGLTSDIDNFYFPKNSFGLRLQTNPAKWCDIDLWARLAGRLENTVVGEYTTLDARLALRPMQGLEVAVVGKDLLEKERTEFVAQIFSYEVKTPRRFHCTVSWGF